jgi:tetratricopeptide (TPR) repeat protein
VSARGRKRARSGASNLPVVALRKTAVAKPPRPTLNHRRTWLFRLVVMVVSPVLFLALLEAGLRLGGYGYPTTFLLGPDANGICTSNRQFGWRFFPRPIARKPVSCVISAKPAGAVRIYILGSSAAQGIPAPAFSVARILEVLLRERYPDVKFEVVNGAMTAINSHVTLEIARDCAEHQPDLFVVYMGNNEVVGPFGPGTVFQQWSPSLRLIRTSVWLKSTRIGQLLGDVAGWLRSRKGSATTWQGMEMFLGNQVAADDPRLPAAYDNFRQNLLDICGAARRARAGVILSTVAVNLKDCPPFASQHRSDLPAEDLTKWKSLYECGVELESKKDWPAATAKYSAAAQIDDRFAELQFRLGRCLAASRRSAEARDRFVSARDLDVLRFRADSRINAIIREVAAEQEADGVRLLDAEQSLAHSDLAPGGVPGEGLFYEHVHFTFEGNYLLARAFLDEVEAALPRLAASRKQEPVLSREQCAASLALTPWDECQMAKQMTEMTSRPPFTSQLDHALRQALAQKRAEELGRLAGTSQAVRAAHATYEAALEKTPDDCDLHYNFAKLALATGQPKLALERLQIVRQKWPWESIVYNDLGQAAGSCGLTDQAVAEYQKALQIDPWCAMAHYNLANTLDSQGKTNEAIAEFHKALDVDPGSALTHNNLGNALLSRGQHEEAIAEFRKALELDPKCVQAHNNLGNSLRDRGRLDEAIVEFQSALAIDPRLAAVHYNLAVALNDRGRIDEAAGHYEHALKIDPGLVVAQNNLGDILRRQGRLDEAIARFEKALAIKPDFAEARANLDNAIEMRDRGRGKQ